MKIEVSAFGNFLTDTGSMDCNQVNVNVFRFRRSLPSVPHGAIFFYIFALYKCTFTYVLTKNSIALLQVRSMVWLIFICTRSLNDSQRYASLVLTCFQLISILSLPHGRRLCSSWTLWGRSGTHRCCIRTSLSDVKLDFRSMMWNWMAKQLKRRKALHDL